MTGSSQAGAAGRVYPAHRALNLLRGMTELGAPAEKTLAGSGLAPEALERPSARVSLDQVGRLYANAVRLADRPDVGLHLGGRLSPPDYGAFGYAVTTARTLGDAVAVATDFPELQTPAVDLSFRPDAAPGRFAILGGYALREPSARLFATELTFASMFSFFRALLGEEIRFDEIRIEQDAPAHAARYEELFQCPCRFGAERSGVLFPSEWLERPILSANSRTHDLMLRRCAEELFGIRSPQGHARRIVELLESDPRRFSSFDAVAAHLGVSVRTLRRRLDDEGASFKSILEKTRLELAIRFLRDLRLSAEETAYRLGYSDAANFRTAFKRWTGLTIRAFLRRNR